MWNGGPRSSRAASRETETRVSDQCAPFFHRALPITVSALSTFRKGRAFRPVNPAGQLADPCGGRARRSLCGYAESVCRPGLRRWR